MAKRSYDITIENDKYIAVEAAKRQVGKKDIVNEALRKARTDISNKELLKELKKHIDKI